MKTLVIGKNGQLAWELQQTCSKEIELVVKGASELDVTDRNAVLTAIVQIQPDVVINASAYTAVDKAESDEEAAHKVNAVGPTNIASACEKVGARLIHVSTDFVFDGEGNSPYKTSDKTNPLGVYGKTKRAGELAVTEILGEQAAIVRTAWVYSAHGNNFVKTMLRLMNERDVLGVVADQKGTPTWAKSLANACWAIALDKSLSGIFHWTDGGEATWHDFAVEIERQGKELGLLGSNTEVNAIGTADYPTPAKRPSYSVLDTTALNEKIPAVDWKNQLTEMLKELKELT